MAERKVLSFIRNIFKRDNFGAEDGPKYKKFKFSAFDGPNVGGYGSLYSQGSNYGGSYAEGMQEDLLTRYADYEDMEEVAELSSSLDLISDDATQTDYMTGQIVHIDCEDDKISELLNTCFHKNLRIDEEIWEMCRVTCKYGNNFEEHVVNEHDGLIGLNFLPPAQIRRIDDIDGSLLGFVYDKSGQFAISTEEFEKRLKDRKYNEQEYLQSHLMTNVLEDWEVTHFRLRSKHRGSQYGWSFLDGARWVTKRLLMLEDAAILYKLCLRGDSKIWTDKGVSLIKDIQEGDVVYSYSENNKLIKTNVVYKKHNGKDRIFRVFSMHRDLYANATHPVLVEETIRQGSGRPVLKIKKYVEVQHLNPDIHRFVTPKKNEQDFDIIRLKKPDGEKRAWLKQSIIDQGFKRKVSWQKSGVSQPYGIEFSLGERSLPYETAVNICEDNGYDSNQSLEIKEVWSGIEELNLPTYIDADFARWFGFMLGDGYVMQTVDQNGFNHSRVGFALGSDSFINNKYITLFKKFVGRVFVSTSEKKLGSCCVNSKPFSEFMILNGFISGAKNKRLPQWVFQVSQDLKMEFLHGLMDADGHWESVQHSERRGSIEFLTAKLELCNEAMVNDVRDLCFQMGIVCTRVITRTREGGRIINGNRKPLPTTTSYAVLVSFKTMPDTEAIKGIEEVDIDDIWDIGVSSTEHNFIADGVVVHNTRAPQRYVFNVDVGDLPPNESLRYLEQVRQRIKKEKYVNPRTGKLDLTAGLGANDEDFFIPTRKDKPSMAVETVGGFDTAFYMDDIEYFKDKLYAAIKIPKDYLNYSADSVSKANLSTEDIKFCRTVIRIQRALRTGLINMGRIHLAALGKDPDMVDFDIYLTPPSSIFEMAMMEVRQAQLSIAESYRAFVDDYWIMANVLKFTDEEIAEIQERLKKQKGEDNPFSEERFPKVVENKKMNKEVRSMMDEMGMEAFKKDPEIKDSIFAMEEMGEEIKRALKKKKIGHQQKKR